MSTPPGREGRLSLDFALWVIDRVKPALWRKALRFGILLEPLVIDRIVNLKQATVPINLYFKWLYEPLGGAAGIRSLRGILYEYEEDGYTRPGVNGEPGECRTYHVYGEVVRRIQAGPHLESLSKRDIDCVVAFLLELKGTSLDEIARILQRHKEKLRSRSTISTWVKHGRALIERVTDSNNLVQYGSEAREPKRATLSRRYHARLDAKGRTTIPSKVRREFGLFAGEFVWIEVQASSNDPDG